MVPVWLAIAGSVVLTTAVAASDALENGLLRKPSGQVLRFVLSRVTDLDADGYGLIGRLSDPAPFDGSVFPYAIEIPGNGVDENGIGGDLPLARVSFSEASVTAGAWTRTPDIVLIGLESFRADVLKSRLGDRAVTPVMNALAESGVSSDAAYSHNGYTVQSRFHLFAGSLLPRPHAPTLIDDFKRNGYVVGYFSGQDESFGSEVYRIGLDRADAAYDARADVDKRYSTFTTPGSLAIPHQVVHDRVHAFLRDRETDARPMFLYVSFGDSHFPYGHDGLESLVSDVRLPRGDIVPANHAALWATYLNTVANIDRAVGRVLDSVRRIRGRHPAVIITADHGESLFESGFLGHGYGLDDVQTKVPLIVANLPMRIHEPFGHVDLRGALTEALTTPLGQDARPVADFSASRQVFQYLGEIRRPRQVGFLRDGRRLIYDFRTNRVRLWDDEWVAPATFTGRDLEEFDQLIHHWEAMNLARAEAAGERE
jgi:arylsulfatase A-like enzyme